MATLRFHRPCIRLGTGHPLPPSSANKCIGVICLRGWVRCKYMILREFLANALGQRSYGSFVAVAARAAANSPEDRRGALIHFYCALWGLNCLQTGWRNRREVPHGVFKHQAHRWSVGGHGLQSQGRSESERRESGPASDQRLMLDRELVSGRARERWCTLVCEIESVYRRCTFNDDRCRG
jgi:hypothetical protein